MSQLPTLAALLNHQAGGVTREQVPLLQAASLNPCRLTVIKTGSVHPGTHLSQLPGKSYH